MLRRGLATRPRGLGVLLSVAAVVLSGCSLSLPFSLGFGGGSGGGFDGSEITVPVLYSTGAKGGVTSQRITASPAEGTGLSIDITENDVSGVDAVTQSATWTAVTAATLLTGARPDTAYTFGFDARIATPAAGAITAVGVLALFYDTEVQPGVALAGTVTPLGTIGPVDGLPEQVAAAIEKGGIDTILVPAGQREAVDATGATVDLDQLAATGGMTVAEVADIASAYAVVTGEDLPEAVFPTPPASPTPLPTIDDADSDIDSGGTADAAAAALRARFEVAADRLDAPDADADLAAEARSAAESADALSAAGEPDAAAAALAGYAAALDTAAAATAPGSAPSVAASVAADTRSAAQTVLQELIAQRPGSLDDADAALWAYAAAVKAFLFADYASDALTATGAGSSSGDAEPYDEVERAGVTAAQVAASALVTAQTIAAARVDAGDGALASDADLAGVASLLRRASVAAADAFASTALARAGDSGEVSVDVAAARLALADPTLLGVAAAGRGSDDLAALVADDDGGWSALGVASATFLLVEPGARFAGSAAVPADAASADGPTADDADAATLRAAVADEYTVRAVDALRTAGARAEVTAGASVWATANGGDATAYTSPFTLARVLAFAGGIQS